MSTSMWPVEDCISGWFTEANTKLRNETFLPSERINEGIVAQQDEITA